MQIKKVKGTKNTYRKARFYEVHETWTYIIYFTVIWGLCIAAQFI